MYTGIYINIFFSVRIYKTLLTGGMKKFTFSYILFYSV